MILRDRYGTNSVAFAEGLQVRAMVLAGADRPGQAEQLSRRSVQLIETALGKDDYYVGLALWTLGGILHKLARYEEAASVCEKSRNILLKTVNRNHMTVALVNATLAECYRLMGNKDQARSLLSQNLAVLEMTFGRDSLHAANVIDSLGVLALEKGDYEEAERSFQMSLAARERFIGTNSFGYAATLNNVALVLLSKGRPAEEVAKLYERAAQTVERGHGELNTELATILVNWSSLLENVGKLDAAEELALRALRILQATFENPHPGIARCMNACASILARRGRYTEALRLANKAMGTYRQILGEDHPGIADCFFVVGDILEKLECYVLAADAFARWVSINEECFGDDVPIVAFGHERIADVYAAANDYDASLTNYFWAIVAENRIVRRSFGMLQEVEALAKTESLRFSAGKLHSLCRLYDKSEFGLAPLLGAYESASAKAVLEEMHAVQARFEVQASTKTEELVRRRSQALAELHSLSEKHEDLVQRDKRRQELQTVLHDIENDIFSRIGAAELEAIKALASLTEIPEKLSKGTGLVDFVYYFRFNFDADPRTWEEARYAAYLTVPTNGESGNEPTIIRIDIGEAALINALIDSVSKRMAASQYRARDLAPALEQLSRLVYAPLAPHLTNVTHLIVCPDGQLNRIPFEMLSHDGKNLVEQKTISYVTSGREIVRLAHRRAEAKPKDQNRPSLVFGNPDFNLDLAGSSRREEAQAEGKRKNAEGRSEVRNLASPAEAVDQSAIRNPQSAMEPVLVPSAAAPQLRSLSRNYRGFQFTPLPGSEQEARQVAGLLGQECVLKLGADAREADLKAVQSPRVLHLATHGFFLSDQEFTRTNARTELAFASDALPFRRPPREDDWENPMIRCGIALAGANHATQITNAVAEDGLLTGLEAALLNLQGTELVILSACDSGTGEVKIGEGVMSLRRAFRIAGAETVLASHWKVSDKATGRLMAEFLRRWRAGEPRVTAWREAQSALRRSKEFSDPFFWAAFTLTGEWR